MLGYPGAGKTTTAHLIAELTGAVHIWTDAVWRELFPEPTYTQEEKAELYENLNTRAAQLLENGRSVVYDTGFNYYSDRTRMYQIAARYNVKTTLVWLQVPVALACKRATANVSRGDTRLLGDALGNMSKTDFDEIVSHLEPPHADESVVIMDGTKITATYVQDLIPN
jgi:predicted kinase